MAVIATQAVDEIGAPVRIVPAVQMLENIRAGTGRRRWGDDRIRIVVERDHLIALNSEPDVVNIVSQPFWRFWRDERDTEFCHAPDFLVYLPVVAGW
ncbi:hypothetical protein AB0H00_12415 [Nocardia sp. NPDC023852]|uniref:hypothetical protein n=1 Tax=Nocardia sp. NPDC023852 TaxID=3154697 RepID=UPI003406B513